MKFFTLKNGVQTINLDQVVFIEGNIESGVTLHHAAHGVASIPVKDPEDLRRLKSIITTNE